MSITDHPTFVCEDYVSNLCSAGGAALGCAWDFVLSIDPRSPTSCLQCYIRLSDDVSTESCPPVACVCHPPCGRDLTPAWNVSADFPRAQPPCLPQGCKGNSLDKLHPAAGSADISSGLGMLAALAATRPAAALAGDAPRPKSLIMDVEETPASHSAAATVAAAGAAAFNPAPVAQTPDAATADSATASARGVEESRGQSGFGSTYSMFPLKVRESSADGRDGFDCESLNPRRCTLRAGK